MLLEKEMYENYTEKIVFCESEKYSFETVYVKIQPLVDFIYQFILSVCSSGDIRII